MRFVSIGWGFIISIGFGNGFRKRRLFGIIFLPYWRDLVESAG